MPTSPSPPLDSAALTPIVRRALDREGVELIQWSCESFGDSYGARTAGIFHVRGTAREGERGSDLPWSVVLKICRGEEPGEDPGGWNFGPREALGYRSGLLSDLPAPRCFGVEDYPDGTIRIWLECLRDAAGERWPLERYGIAARHLGQFNGAYLTGRPIPTFPWLGQGWMRHLAALADEAVAKCLDPATWRLPQIPGYFVRTGDLVPRLLADRDRLLDGLDRLPQTFCHNDAWRNNLFAVKDASGADRTILIDWASAGAGAVGQDIGPLVHMGVFLFVEEPEQFSEIDRVVFAGYLDGLREAGWKGNARQARLGYAAASVIYAGGQVAMLTLVSLDDDWRKGWERALGRPFEEILARAGALAPHIADLAGEARRLLTELRL